MEVNEDVSSCNNICHNLIPSSLHTPVPVPRSRLSLDRSLSTARDPYRVLARCNAKPVPPIVSATGSLPVEYQGPGIKGSLGSCDRTTE